MAGFTKTDFIWMNGRLVPWADAQIHVTAHALQYGTGVFEGMRSNKLENAYLRPLAFFDSHSFSVWPKDCPVSVAIIAVPGRAYIQGGPESGVRVTVSTVRRIDSSALPAFVKA